jgi:hypothetical protein
MVTPVHQREGHGGFRKIRSGCKCVPCSRTKKAKDHGLRFRVPALGSTRRLRAAATLGYSLQDIHNATGIPSTTLTSIRRGGRDYTRKGPLMIDRHYAITIKRWYDKHQITEAEPGWTTTWSKNIAKKYGWAPPMAWQDITNPQEQPYQGFDGTWYNNLDPIGLDKNNKDLSTYLPLAEKIKANHPGVVLGARRFGDLYRAAGGTIGRERAKILLGYLYPPPARVDEVG